MYPMWSALLRKKISIIHRNSSGIAAGALLPCCSPTHFLPSTMRDTTLSVTMSRCSLTTTGAAPTVVGSTAPVVPVPVVPVPTPGTATVVGTKNPLPAPSIWLS